VAESELIARLTRAEQRLAQLEYEIQILKQQAGANSNTVNILRSPGAG
jgi:uncharacterized protein YigA (DUF484 family)